MGRRVAGGGGGDAGRAGRVKQCLVAVWGWGLLALGSGQRIYAPTGRVKSRLLGSLTLHHPAADCRLAAEVGRTGAGERDGGLAGTASRRKTQTLGVTACVTPQGRKDRGEWKAAPDALGYQRNPGGIGVAQPLTRHFPAILLHQRYTGRQCQ